MIPSMKDLRNRLCNKISNSNRVFIMGHNSPDFDAIGACIGVSVLADYYDKDFYIVVDDEASKIEPGVKKIIDENKEKFHIIDKKEALNLVDDQSILVVVDTNKQSMISLGDSLNLFSDIFIIDHHEEGIDTILTEDSFISIDSSSACEIVSRILNGLKIRYDSSVANYLLAGISLDTKRFKRNTTSITHDVAEKLINNGADIDYVNNLFLEEFDSYCRISNLIINGTTIKKYSQSLLNPIQVSFTLNRNQPETLYLKEDFAKAADRMMKFNGIDAAFALGFVEPCVVHISARSGKRVNVGAIMNMLHGGGNLQCAGGRITTDDIFGVENDLMNAIYYGLEDDEIIEKPKIIKVQQIRKS